MSDPDTVSSCLALLDRHTPPNLARVRLTPAERARLERRGLLRMAEGGRASCAPRKKSGGQYGRVTRLAEEYISKPRKYGDMSAFAQEHGLWLTSLSDAVRRLMARREAAARTQSKAA